MAKSNVMTRSNMNSPTSRCTGSEHWLNLSRRECLNRLGLGLGGIALAELLGKSASAGEEAASTNGALGGCHFTPKAKRVIYLFQSGAPSQLDLFDSKPRLVKDNGQQLPDSVRGTQRLTGMSSSQSSIPLAGSPSCCRTRPKLPTSSASSARYIPSRSITGRASPSCKRGRKFLGGQASERGSITGSAATTRISPHLSCSSRKTRVASR